MLAVRIIPCLDVKDGQVVKGINFENLQTAGDPVEHAIHYEQEGADEIVFLDITASHEKRKIFIDVVKKTAEKVFMPLTVGGGIGSIEDINNLLRAGADKISLNTKAVTSPELIDSSSKRFGSQCIVTAIDARMVSAGKWEVFTHGGRTPTGKDAVEWAREVYNRGTGEILLTSMDGDGTQDGYDLDLTRAIAEAVKIPVIASGGAGKLEHFHDALEKGKAHAVLAASLFHYRTLSIGQVKQYLKEKGHTVRL